ncbi:hypothetical protein QWY14_08170 [Planococcus sp. N028]|uniref:Uncharacterized protein n=1 Tax=Planococcus shixiaomingii TaxID=3058393 RepID=A0ABT8N1J5_9BACL|nr:hypothetical protein [Planococcus sp. N028]MDN7241767.1 hypothetical protein [Planococcus sp. N028]
MGGSITIKVPDLHYVLNQEDVESWEVFWRHGLKQHKQIKRQLYYSEENCTVHHMLLFYGHLKVVKIDFQNNCIVFYRGKAERGEFENFSWKCWILCIFAVIQTACISLFAQNI